MLKSHLDAIEDVLVAQSNIASNAGHPNLRGGPREWFVREFLENHIPSIFEVGQGELINSRSIPSPKPGVYRPQVDVLIYRRDFPKIPYGGGNSAYLFEGVPATIEVKTDLKKPDFINACMKSVVHKKLKYTHPGVEGVVYDPGFSRDVVSYIVAFKGPKNISTIAKWFPKICHDIDESPERLIDMVVVLGKGVIWRILSLQGIRDIKYDIGENYWAYVPQRNGNLFLLYIHMLSWMTHNRVRDYADGVVLSPISVI